MPQKTVTLEDQVYWEVMMLEKGRQSAFINEAVKDAIRACAWNHRAYSRYAMGGLEMARRELRRQDDDAADELAFQRALEHPNQTKLGVDEE